MRAKDNAFMEDYRGIKRESRPDGFQRDKGFSFMSGIDFSDDKLTDAEVYALLLQFKGALSDISFTADEATRDKQKQTALTVLYSLAAASNVVPIYGQMAAATFAMAAFIVQLTVKDKAPYATKAEFDKAMNQYIDMVQKSLNGIDLTDIRNVYPAVLLLSQSYQIMRNFMIRFDDARQKDKGQKVVVQTSWWEDALKRFLNMATPFEQKLMEFNEKQKPALAEWKRKLYALNQNQSPQNIAAARAALENVLRTNTQSISPKFITDTLFTASYPVLVPGFYPSTITDKETVTGRGAPAVPAGVRQTYDRLMKSVLETLPQNTTFGGGPSAANPPADSSSIANTLAGKTNKLTVVGGKISSPQIKEALNPTSTTSTETPMALSTEQHSEAGIKLSLPQEEAKKTISVKIREWFDNNKGLAMAMFIAVILIVAFVIYKYAKK